MPLNRSKPTILYSSSFSSKTVNPIIPPLREDPLIATSFSHIDDDAYGL